MSLPAEAPGCTPATSTMPHGVHLATQLLWLLATALEPQAMDSQTESVFSHNHHRHIPNEVSGCCCLGMEPCKNNRECKSCKGCWLSVVDESGLTLSSDIKVPLERMPSQPPTSTGMMSLMVCRNVCGPNSLVSSGFIRPFFAAFVMLKPSQCLIRMTCM